MYFRYFRARPIGLLSGLGLVLEIVARVSALGVDESKSVIINVVLNSSAVNFHFDRYFIREMMWSSFWN